MLAMAPSAPALALLLLLLQPNSAAGGRPVEAASLRELGGVHSCPSPCLSDGTLDFAAVTRRARMMGVTRVPGVGVGVRVVHGAVTVSQCV